MSVRGTYRVVDGSKVAFRDALSAWAEAGYVELTATAERYQRVTTYLELAELVQDRSGIRTTMLMMNWIGSVLDLVAQRRVRAGVPPLTSLCVHRTARLGADTRRRLSTSART